MSTGKLPPYHQIDWAASTLLDADFGGYAVYSRPAILPAPPFFPVGRLLVPWAASAGERARIKAQHRSFRDYMPGWSGPDSAFVQGYDYIVTAINRHTGLESKIYGSPLFRAKLAPDVDRHWFVTNEAPYLNSAVSIRGIDTDHQEQSTPDSPPLAGRPYGFTRTAMERAGRKLALDWYYHGLGGLPEERVRWPYALAETGRTCALLVPDGDRYVGTLRDVKASRSGDDGAIINVEAEFLETYDWTTADYNLPAGLILNGTSQYLTTASSTAINPGTGAFSVVLCGVFSATSGATHLSKDNGTTGYEFRNSAASTMSVRIRSATGTVTLVVPASINVFDGREHVIVVTSPGTGTGQKVLYVDGVAVAASQTNHGTVTNSDALTVGFDGGASFAADKIHAAAYYGRQLTAAEAAQCGYLLAWSGYKMPGGPATFLDLRDDQSATTIPSRYEDLAGNLAWWTAVGAPTAVGWPWRLRELSTLVPITD